MLSSALLIALDFHEHPAHVLLVWELDKDLPGLQILFGVLMGELRPKLAWRLFHRMVLVISVVLLRIFKPVA